MPTSDVEICNRALTLLGSGQIQSLDDGSDLARTCKTIYSELKRASLAETHWNFATQKRQLAQETDTPITEWEHQYTLPADLVRGPETLYSSSGSEVPEQRWEKVAGKVLTDFNEVYIDYVAEVDEVEFPPYFVEFLSHAVASEIAKNVTDQTTTAQFYDQKAYGPPSSNRNGGLLGKAMRIDSQTTPTQVINDNPLDDVRFGH